MAALGISILSPVDLLPEGEIDVRRVPLLGIHNRETLSEFPGLDELTSARVLGRLLYAVAIMVAFPEPITCEVLRIHFPRTRMNKGKEQGRRISLPHYLRPGSLSGSLSDSLGRHLRVNPRRHILGGGTHEREHRAIRGDEHVALRSGTILKGYRACAIRFDAIRPREAIVTKSLPVKVT